MGDHPNGTRPRCPVLGVDHPELCRLPAEWLATSHMALMLENAADAAEQRLSDSVPASLMWTGPESTFSESRDTAVVVEELFTHAERFMLVSSYAVQRLT